MSIPLAPKYRMSARQKYSHRGCNNCKSSSIKCDEGSPSCLNCLRKGLTCVYKEMILFYQPDKTKRIRKAVKSKKRRQSNSTMETRTESSDVTYSFDAVEESIFKLREDLRHRSSKTPLKEDNLGGNSMDENRETEDVLRVPDYVKYWKPYNKERYKQLIDKLDARGHSKVEIRYNENNPEAQELIWSTFSESKCCYNYLLVTDDKENCVARWFLYFGKKYPIIPFTVNAVTGNLLDVKCFDDRWFGILQLSMSMTLANLSKRVGNCECFAEMSCFLFCVMFLCSERSAARLNAWRTHLRGAYSILTKCDHLFLEKGFNESSNIDEETQYAIDMYEWAKNWFVMAETMACLSAPQGGSINSIDSLVECLNFNDKKGSNEFILGGFNLMKGYSELLTPVFVELISFVVSCSKSEGVSLSGMGGIIYNLPRSRPREIMGERLIQKVTEVQSQEFDLLDVKDYKLRACMKASNRCFCCALKIFIRSVLLGSPIYGNDIQHCVQGIEEELASIPIFDIFGLTIHWPLFVGALCAPPGEQRNTFLHAFQTIVTNGTFVARNTVERVELFWNFIDRGEIVDEKDYDCIIL